MSAPTPPVWEQIDYSRDAVLEASAGTGKTYALEHIVLQLVQKGRVENATQILLVTFTEKAAGELRDRVRDILQKHAAMPEDFDLMTIGTIHSFCRQLLSEHAFENGAPMRLEVTTADKALLREAALAVLHSAAFAAAYGAHFPEWVAVMGCKKLDGDQGALISELVKRAPNPAAAPTAPAPCPPSAIVAGLFAAAAA
ncbi:MAG: UvrD-helicase domain-containing protein, partial [Planctomycetes bacterium]|nr:UvrD-helicase domain-containing protein [Planctomycetota bacterium]